jgi:hypothetical protein
MNGKLNITVEERKCSNYLNGTAEVFSSKSDEWNIMRYEYLSKKVVVDEL